MHISGAMFEVLLQCFQKYSSDIQYVFYQFCSKPLDVISFLICKIQNVSISKTKKNFPKRKMPFFFILESLSNKQQLFSYHRHFNKYSYLKMEHHSSLLRYHLLLQKNAFCGSNPKKRKVEYCLLCSGTLKMKVHFNSQKYNKSLGALNTFF